MVVLFNSHSALTAPMHHNSLEKLMFSLEYAGYVVYAPLDCIIILTSTAMAPDLVLSISWENELNFPRHKV